MPLCKECREFSNTATVSDGLEGVDEICDRCGHYPALGRASGRLESLLSPLIPFAVAMLLHGAVIFAISFLIGLKWTVVLIGAFLMTMLAANKSTSNESKGQKHE